MWRRVSLGQGPSPWLRRASPAPAPEEPLGIRAREGPRQLCLSLPQAAASSVLSVGGIRRLHGSRIKKTREKNRQGRGEKTQGRPEGASRRWRPAEWRQPSRHRPCRQGSRRALTIVPRLSREETGHGGATCVARSYDLRMTSVTRAATDEAWTPSTFSATSSGVPESAGRPFSPTPMIVIERRDERIAGVASVSAQS